MSMQTVPAADAAGQDVLNLASQIVGAYVRNNPVPVGDLPTVIKDVHGTLRGLTGANSDSVATNQKLVAVSDTARPVQIAIAPHKTIRMIFPPRAILLVR